MKVRQFIKSGESWDRPLERDGLENAQLILIFGGTEPVEKGIFLKELRNLFPESAILGCSTAGEIAGTEVRDNTIVANVIEFEKSRISMVMVDRKKYNDSYSVGKELYNKMDKNELRHIFVLSSGMKINGSELVRGINENIAGDITVSGGIAGDGERFQNSFVIYNDSIEDDAVAAVGFHGRDLLVGCGSMGGWDPFGPERLVTKSAGNILYEVDDIPSLELYKRYLGDYAAGLPAAGLLFPLSLRIPGRERGLVRTILAVDEKNKSITFAGDIPEKSYVRFMKANINRLLDGSFTAAEVSMRSFGDKSPELAILISCVGRKLVFKQRVEEELEAVIDVLGDASHLTGFYSYGEIAPFEPRGKCELHNQTMTITALAEL